MNDIAEVLRDLAIRIPDNGDHWQTHLSQSNNFARAKKRKDALDRR